MTIDNKVEKMRDQFNMDLKGIYKTITKFKVNIGILMDSVENLNKYTHERIHSLTNTDKGIELVLAHIQERVKTLTSDRESKKEIATTWKKQAIRCFFHVCSSSLLILIGMAFEGHWFQ